MLKIDWNPDRKKLRQFGLTMLVSFSVIGLLLGWKLGSFQGEAGWAVPGVIWAVGGFVGLLGWLAPGTVRPIYLVWMGLAFPVGWGMSHIFLGIIYFGLFAAVGFTFKLIGRDPLRRKKAIRNTCWIERKEETPAGRYFRQF